MPELRLGLLDLLTLPFSLPLKLGVTGLMEAVERAHREVTDPEVVYRKMAELQMAYELGELDEAGYRQGLRALERRLQALEQQERGPDR